MDLITLCVNGVIHIFDFEDLKSLTPHESTVKVIGLMRFCFEAGVGPITYPTVLDQLLVRAQDSEYQSNLVNILCPLISRLRTFLVKREGVAWTTSPAAQFCAAVLKAFVATIVGQKPAHEDIPARLKTLGCGCSDCKSLATFFCSGRGPSHNVCATQKIRTHVELELKKVNASSLGVETSTVKVKSPHTLVVSVLVLYSHALNLNPLS